MNNAKPQFSVGVDTTGRVVLFICDGASTLNTDIPLETAEWLRDRLFHICAHERAMRAVPAEKPKGET